ncbi:MAG: 4Fe-4S binding protein [Myxococcota bacterium]|nr:4Fe-4S binding protein [Myxococcota bacterium]
MIKILSYFLIALGAAQFVGALFHHPIGGQWLALLLCYGPLALGILILPLATYGGTTPGIKNNLTVTRYKGWRSLSGWIVAFVLIGFYVCLYWFPAVLRGPIEMLDPLSKAHTGKPPDQWYLYGFLYTFAVLTMGVRFYYRYRHNRYQIIRNASVMAIQLVLAFAIPGFLKALHQPEFYFTYFWPLKPNYLYPDTVQSLSSHPGGLGTAFVFWATAVSFVGVPVLTYIWGKRWYCSWVCGCGALAETLGDPFRHLSNKSLKAWRFERWSIHLVLVIIFLGTLLLWIQAGTGGSLLGQASRQFNKWYGFIVGATLAGVVGTGFYSLFGNRVWCRFFCPQAAILGIVQRFFSRFRITTNGDQCMSCGNCSTYCEMGIDVRYYAQQGQNIVRASCVGCGICSAVCPRGVLKLENGKTHKDRYDGADRPLHALWRSLTWR